jgi:DNA replication protein DnaC
MTRAISPRAVTTLDSIKRSLVGLRMLRALEVLDATVRRIEQGEIDGISALDEILTEELTLRENRRVKTALLVARLTTIKTLAGFDFTFQPSLDRERILALAELTFIDRSEAVHLLGPPGTGKSHLATALAVEAVKAGRSVVFSTLADLITSLAKAERDGSLRERIRYLCRAALLVVDEIGHLPVVPGGGNLFFQLVNTRYEKGAMILTSNRGFAEWGEVFGTPSWPRHCSTVSCTTPWSSRSRGRATVCVSMPISCPSMSARRPSSPRRPLPSAAAAHLERRRSITQSADHRPPPNPPAREF